MTSKRIFDLYVSVFFLVLLSPLMVVTAITVLASMGWPVVFRQLRPGLKGKPFFVLKFRTMTNQSDAEGHLLPDEVRLTKIGKLLRRLSLDELPQLFNVLSGELSMVGPRPLLMEYLPLYNREQARRHEVKPGITGWAQVNGRNALSWDDKFKLDVWYVDNRSFWLDMKILWMTIVKVFNQEGISQETHATAEKFRGNG